MNKDDVTIVFNGFLRLPNLDKLRLVNAINEYFDSNERETIRRRHDAEFALIDMTTRPCTCCGSTRPDQDRNEL